ncbi:MAG: hypothetical protein JRC99_00025 [Deltaproteobacteria bacterium]|nr:hypothetical protein [Deltaproteobacteria bacterium]
MINPDNIQSQISAAGDSEDSSGQSNWLIIEQAKIPEAQQVATVQDLEAGIRQLEAGHPAETAFTGQCPVQFGANAEGRKLVTYRLVFYVHRSESIKYEIEVTQGGEILDHQGPAQGRLKKGKSWVIDKNKTQQLGWRPFLGNIRTRWEIVFNTATARRILNPLEQPEVEQDDGFIYLKGDAVVGSLRVDGVADCDKYTVSIGQQGGTSWTGDLYTTAYWPVGVPRKDQQRVTEELFIPECVKYEIERCQESIEEAGNPAETSGFFPPVHLDVDKCNHEVIGKTPNTDPPNDCKLCLKI